MYVLLYSSGEYDGVSDYFCGVYSKYYLALDAIGKKLLAYPQDKAEDYVVREVQVDADFQ